MQPIDPRGRARAAAICLWLFALAQGLELATAAAVRATHAAPGDPYGLVAAWGVAAMAQFVLYLACAVAVGLWIHRASANAHALADGLAITPGWAVGWFFVPIASLFKPFEALRETWQASFAPSDWAFVPTPPLLRWWWGAWLVSNLAGGLDWRLSWSGLGPSEEGATVSILALATGIASLVSAMLMIRIVRRLTAAQATAIAGHVFA